MIKDNNQLKGMKIQEKFSNLKKISITMLTKNNETYIGKSLQALIEFDEVLILDNGSTDNTLGIAAKFPNTTIKKSKFIGFGKLKTKAGELAKNDWIFTVDSDEIVSQELLNEIKNLELDVYCVYSVPRFNYYNNKHIKHCGWHPQTIVRLYHRNKTKYTDSPVHEGVITKDLKTVYLKNPLHHYPMNSVTDFIDKTQLYSGLYAQKKRYNKKMNTLFTILNAKFCFFKKYFLQAGFLSGYEGYVISCSDANGVRYKLLKLIEENNKLDISLIITTYNWKESLEVILLSAINQTLKPKEIIIADDGSKEDTRELIQKYQNNSPIPIIHVWQEDKGFRVAAIRNKAIKKATGEYIVFVDGDIILHPDFIKDHQKSAWKGYFIQGSRAFINQNQTNHIIKEKMFKLPTHIAGWGNINKTIRCGILSLLFSNPSKSLKGVRSCNLGVWKEDIYKINGFNEEFEGWGREDSEFIVRLKNTGITRKNLRFKAICYHLHHKTEKRDRLKKNDKLLKNSMDKNLKWCPLGLIKKNQE